MKIDEKEIQTHLAGLVRQSVENALKVFLNSGIDAIYQVTGKFALHFSLLQKFVMVRVFQPI